MEREDIIRLAREAGFIYLDLLRMAREAGFICLSPDEAVNGIGTIYDSGDEEITEMMGRFAALVAAHEREACARVCFDEWKKTPEPGNARDCWHAIRARGEK